MSSEEVPAVEAESGDGGEKEEVVKLEDLPMTGVTDPREADVLCGRGGAALRHPGNQTYRRLVNLNKGLYITCLKTEKLKISRSIVAAIREQNGRFLEREAKKGTWYDIGDKKAIEKTSQALREGQPKLRQKMIDSGQIPPDQGMRMEHQFGNGIYNPRGGASGSVTGSVGYSDQSGYGMQQMNQPQMQHQTSMADMPPPPSRTMSGDPDLLMQRLSLSSLNPQSIPSWTPSLASSMDAGSMRARLIPSLQARGSSVADQLGIMDSNLSLMSDFSAYGQMMNENRFGMDVEGMGDHMNHPYAMGSMGSAAAAPPPPPPPPPPDISPMMASPSLRSGYDRRHLFAKMKYSRPSSGVHQPPQLGNDGMPDIHMVDSQFSLMSNLSGHGSNHNALGHGSRHDALAQGSRPDSLGPGSRHEASNGLPNFSDPGQMKDSEMFGVGSRRSLMSGLSRISDNSDVHSVFSDMGRKIGTSSRSIAMSEISGIDEGLLDLQQTFDIDPVPSSARSSERAHT